MNRSERWLLDISNVLVGGTGVVYAAMKYLLESSDEWAVVNHPWQPHVHHLHIVAAPLLVFVGGLFWSRHVVERMGDTQSDRRRTGLTLLFQFVPMVLSGYLIQVSVSETWRTVWTWIHLSTASLWIVMAVAHRIRIPRTIGRSTEPQL